MKCYYSDVFELPLPAGHRFPLEKYRLLRERLENSEHRDKFELRIPAAAADEQLLLVHTADYLEKLRRGTLSRLEERRIGFPWSPEMVERSRRSTGGTIEAACAAILDKVGVHLAGGTHHAFPDHGQGYCVFNDVAVAIRVLQVRGLIRRAVVIDLDVHQGNGTAAIFAEDPTVFTFSIHGARNFPFDKCDGDLDVALPDGTSDEHYLAALREVLDDRLPLADAEMVFYLAGADPYQFDRLGRLKLTLAGLARRDQMVFAACRQHGIPLVVVMAGGYAQDIEDVVSINVATVTSLLECYAESTLTGMVP